MWVKDGGSRKKNKPTSTQHPKVEPEKKSRTCSIL